MSFVECERDLFNRANNADLGSLWDTYASWNSFEIDTNQVRAAVVAQDNVERYAAVLPDDQWAEVTASIWSGTSDYRNLHACCRLQAPNTHSGYTGALEFPNPSGEVVIGKFIATAFSVLARSSQTVSQSDTVLLSVIGTGLTVYQNGTQRTTASDSDLSSGRAGIASYCDVANTDASIDTFRCGRHGRYDNVLGRGVCRGIVGGGR